MQRMAKNGMAALCASLLLTSALMAEPPGQTKKPSPAAPAKQKAVATEKATPQLSSRPTMSIALPMGTAVRMRLEQALSADKNSRGDEFTGRITQDVIVDGKTVIPHGSSLTGSVTYASGAKRFAGRPSLELLPQTVILPDGVTVPIIATVVDTSDPKRFDVNDEGRINGQRRNSGDNIELAAGTGVGLVTGAIFGGAKGSLIGAVTGAGITTVHSLMKKHSMTVPAGTEIIMEISGPVTGTQAAADGQ